MSVAIRLIAAIIGSFPALAAQLEVCPSCELHSLREAIAKAPAGATLEVHGGTYREGALLIRRPVKLHGVGNPILDGGGQVQPILVEKADDVEISGFTIQNTGMSYTAELAAIRVAGSKRAFIHDNRILRATYGVYLESSEDCTVTGNTITGEAKDEVTGGNGIHVWYGKNDRIEGNQIQGHRDGIYLEFVSDSTIRNNIVSRNIRYGLHFMQASRTQYHHNLFSNNGAGVAVMYSRDIQMHNNRFSANKGPAAYGLLMKEVMSSDVLHNEFSDNTVGLYMEGSNRSRFSGNRFSDNGWALRIMGDCEENKFSGNDFIRNSFEVATNSDHSWNTFERNYWSLYDGYDLDSDGVGDIPHRPVSLTTVILENVDSSYILMSSFLFAMLDQIEHALPTLIPEPLKDEQPLLKPAAAGVQE